ncbi:MAG: hypothetical protein ABUT39_04835 [Acidobacteriota bacterium]
MKSSFFRVPALAGLVLLAVPLTGAAEVRQIELDVAGYLCGE